jgi:hypothetical protein
MNCVIKPGVSAQTKFVIENFKSDSHVWFRYAAIVRKRQETAVGADDESCCLKQNLKNKNASNSLRVGAF